MKKYRFLFSLVLLWAVAMPMFSQVVSNDNEDEVYKVNQQMASCDFVPGQVLVKFKDEHRVNIRRSKGKFMSVDRNAVNAVLAEFGVEEMEQLLPNEKPGRSLRKARAYNGDVVAEKDLSQLYCVKISTEHQQETMQLVEQLQALDEVEFAEPNYRLYTLDDVISSCFDVNPFFNSQWYLEDYGVKELWNKPIINKNRPVIAILDTGVDINHPDLVGNIWTNTEESVGESGYDNDNNGFKNDVHGWDFINNTGKIRDYNMHGTHVAGIAAASDNGIGIIGANPKAIVMPVTVMQSDGSGDVATIVKGVNYAIANGATILNFSLGTYANSKALRQALEMAYQSAVIVAAAGNDGLQILPVCKPLMPYGPMFPAAYSFVLGVQATNQEGNVAGFSNYDCDGPNYSSTSSLQDPDGFNYELKAPGTEMLSTIPGGSYKTLSGTSMSAPLVAGAISALKMVKRYDTQEILWGDLLHTDNIAQAYRLAKRPAELDLMKIMYRERKELSEETEEDYSGDGEIDAGETVLLYPVIRTTFGPASNIKMHLEMGDEFEDPNTVQILTGIVDFGLHLDAYGKGVSLNPLKLKIAEDVADGRHIKMKFVATCDESEVIYEGHFTMVVNNVVKINGLISEDMTLTADHIYYVNENLGVMDGATLTIEPGSRLEFAQGMGLAVYGNLHANGNPDNPIVFTCHEQNKTWAGISSQGTRDTISYCVIEKVLFNNKSKRHPYAIDCIFSELSGHPYYFFNNTGGMRNNIVSSKMNAGWTWLSDSEEQARFGITMKQSNIVHNLWSDYDNRTRSLPDYGSINSNNYFDNYANSSISGSYYGKRYSITCYYNTPMIITSSEPSYFGTSKEDYIRPYIFELGNAPETYAKADLSNILTTPVSEAHGIVWKVVVNGYDAQDEFDMLPPLGIGKHKFEVYFNRPMNKEVTPKISFGLRDPWTQQIVAEDGSWNEEGTIYTAYKTITGKTKSDGLNRIYVYGAEDNEYFEIPYEKTRFNIYVQAAGSMATGFAAEAGMGKVNLTWNNDENNFEDALGFNVYRYTIDEAGKADTIRINDEIVDIETTAYTDYDVVPGTTYYYLYRVLSTDLKEFDVSNVVAVTPLTSTKGDANGSGDVDVADVITTVNYAAGQQPKPFIFEAADMNEDLSIDILDVIGIIKQIMNPNSEAKASVAAVASYTIEDGVVYVDSPVEIAGVQVQLSLSEKLKENNEKLITVAEDMKGFEHTSAWLSDNDYLFLGYNMNGKTLKAGKHAILIIGDAQIADIRLSDRNGHNIIAESTTVDKIDRMARDVMTVGGIYDLQGRKISGNASDLQKLPKGVYIINGVKVVR
ncbi:MAG: S8 family serine peptidase [Prevotella sp.]|nr:S8 family serine peptidase [Prevotella sp.]